MKGVVAGVLQLGFDAAVLRGENGGECAALQTLREVRGRQHKELATIKESLNRLAAPDWPNLPLPGICKTSFDNQRLPSNDSVP